MTPEIKTERIEDLLFYETKPVLELKLEYPQVFGNIHGNCENKFNLYYLKSAERTNLYLRTDIYKKATLAYKNSLKTGFPFDFMIFEKTFQTTFNNSNFISIYFDTYKFEGGAHGLTTRKAETWNTKIGGVVNLSSFFVKGFNYGKFICEEISKDIENDLENSESVYYKNAPERCKRLFDERRYYLSDTGFIFFFPSYSIAPYYAGIRTFEVPYIKFGDKLKSIPNIKT